MNKRRAGLHRKCNSYPFLIIIAYSGELMIAATKRGVGMCAYAIAPPSC